MREVLCDACAKTTPITANEWGRIFAVGAKVSSTKIGHEITMDILPSAKPACGSCATPMPLDVLAIGSDATATCKCGEPLVTYPAPPWLREAVPALVQLYGADREDTTSQPTRAHVEPVAMACPKCGGSLDIAADAQRTTKCKFCSASIYLPDDLWRSLHPVKTVRAWTFAFEGALTTTEDAARRARELTEAAEAFARDRTKMKRYRMQLIVFVVLLVAGLGAIAIFSR